jgi:hypothetical protein
MGLAIGAISAYGTSIQPMSYTVKNQSQVSDAFTESVGQTGAVQLPGRVGVVNPVQYPNAKLADDRQVDMTTAVVKSQSANQKMNQVAAGYAGMTTGYGSDSSAKGYELIGSILDLYA